ncbi:hypothetical protein BDM02DRAFT_3260885 [Thelephora ganbajun]|uniref:Uncharacterized protein n=1 Tax=Thelephora ganbajun TaxID=370292 RepID=A0ACB6ZGK3_THEGA|nr:hypothetical protein BDM02DRAFT_3260885 [Thelephora ganbajun]
MASDNIPNLYAYHGRHLLAQYQARYQTQYRAQYRAHPQSDFRGDIFDYSPSDMKNAFQLRPPSPEFPVCIIGAGMAGLYTAMIFESLGIPYQIVDTNTRERIGGRIFTYRFPGGGTYDYFDVGAMRFPDTPFMKRTFDLVRNRGLSVKLIPYIRNMVEPSPNTFLFYNNARVNNGAPSATDNPFNVDHVDDPSLRTPEGVSQRVAEVLRPFRGLFRVDPWDPPLDIAKAMEDLSKWVDRLSMRSCMSNILGMSAREISWCETLDKATGSYNQALAETVIGSLVFNWPGKPPKDPNADWYCFDLMDLTGANIASGQRSAIRELQYEPAVKVGIKFSCPWWETELPQRIHGGQSYTDLPLRTIVYPSYPHGVTPDKMSKVLIVSYSWVQDAERLGALINNDGTAQPELIELVFRDLAAVHGVTVEWLQNFYKTGDYFAWDWLRNPLTMGGYAHFGPGSYDVYSDMVLPAANGKLFFAGEATSDCRGWVTGALNSAWRAVDQYLNLSKLEEARKKFHESWGASEHWDEVPPKKGKTPFGVGPKDGASYLELVELDRKLADRQLVIGLYESGIRPPPRESI